MKIKRYKMKYENANQENYFKDIKTYKKEIIIEEDKGEGEDNEEIKVEENEDKENSNKDNEEWNEEDDEENNENIEEKDGEDIEEENNEIEEKNGKDNEDIGEEIEEDNEKGLLRILGKEFVKSNKNKGKLIINNKRYKLEEFIKIEDNKVQNYKLQMILSKDLSNYSYMFKDG